MMEVGDLGSQNERLAAEVVVIQRELERTGRGDPEVAELIQQAGESRQIGDQAVRDALRVLHRAFGVEG